MPPQWLSAACMPRSGCQPTLQNVKSDVRYDSDTLIQLLRTAVAVRGCVLVV